MTSKLKALGGCSGHLLQGAGAHCVYRITGCTACFAFVFVLSLGGFG